MDSFRLSALNIIDLTDSVSYELFEKSLSEQNFKQLDEPAVIPWKEERECKKLLDALSGNSHDRTQILI